MPWYKNGSSVNNSEHDEAKAGPMMSTYIGYLAWGAGGWGDEFFFAFIMTMKVSLSAYLISVLFGLLAAVFKLSRSWIMRSLAGVYITVVRALPELLMILIVYFTVAGLAEQGLLWAGVVYKGF